MKTKEKKKRRFNFKKFIIFIVLIILLSLVVYKLFNTKTKNIVILNNDYYSDDEIIDTAGIYNYPNFLTLNSSRIKKKLEKLDLVDEVKIKKKFGFILQIDVKENKILYYIRSKDEYMLSNYKSIKLDNITGVPTLINYVPEEIEKSFIKEFSKLDKNIISLISEIEYNKTQYDEKRFLLYMNDGNQVYITVTKIDILSKYVDIVKKLNNKKGILYLDSGNYFEIKE